MTGIMAGAGMVGFKNPLSPGATVGLESFGASSSQSESNRPDYVLRISASPVEIAPKHIVSTITYNGQFPQALCCVSKKVSPPRSKSTTTPTLLSS